MRLNLKKTDPVVCLQWQGLIAVSYAARRYGISRHETMADAKKKCPNIIFAHVATFKKGHEEWSYNNNERPNPQVHKVSLDPYRRTSRKIFDVLHKTVNTMEKASIDETYIDLGQLVYEKAVDLFPVLAYLKPDDLLPDPPKLKDLPANLGWVGRVIGSNSDEPLGEAVGMDLYKFEDDIPKVEDATAKQKTPDPPEKESSNAKPNLMNKYEQKMIRPEPNKANEPVEIKKDAPLEITDWDDVFLMIGSNIVKDLRKSILDELGYTCSVGIARNKSLAKLGSGILKPATQNIVRTLAIPGFLNRFEITDMGGLGGKLGDQLISSLKIPKKGSIPYLLKIPRDELQSKTTPKLTKKLMKLIRGTEYLPIGTRTDIKSMASVKNFARFALKGHKDAVEWIKVYAADLAGRIIEICEEKDRDSKSDYIVTPLVQHYPKSVVISLKSGLRTAPHSKSAQFPSGITRKGLSKALFETGCNILKQMEADVGGPNSKSGLYPCERLSLEIHGFIPKTDISGPGGSHKPISSFFKSVKTEKKEEQREQNVPEAPVAESTTLPFKDLINAPVTPKFDEKAFSFGDESDTEDIVDTNEILQNESNDSPNSPTNSSNELTTELPPNPILGSSSLFQRKRVPSTEPRRASPSKQPFSNTPSTNSLASSISLPKDVPPSTVHDTDNLDADQPDEDLFVKSSESPQPASSSLTVRCPRCNFDVQLEELFSHEDWHDDQDKLKALKKGNTSLTSFFKPNLTFKATPKGETPNLVQPGGVPKQVTLSKRPPPPSSNGLKNPKDPKKPKLSKNQTFLKFD